MGRAFIRNEIVSGVNEADMRKSLRKITKQNPRSPIIFLCKEAKIIPHGKQLLEEGLRLILSPTQDIGIRQPETAREERPLTAPNPVVHLLG
jgi:hypothetical protein